MAECKICKKEKNRKLVTRGAYTAYIDEDAKYWHGRVCPSCIKYDAKRRRGTDVKHEVTCAECSKAFDTNRSDKKTCSQQCYNRRRSKLESLRQKKIRANPDVSQSRR